LRVDPEGALIFKDALASGFGRSVTLWLRDGLRVLHSQKSWLTPRWAINPIRTIFEPSWYLETYPDVAKAGINPLQHYLRFGAAEGRDPCPLFQTRWYLETYPDVAKAGINPPLHYLQFGAAEGRDPCPLFHTRWYIETYPDAAKAGINPLQHYLQFGAAEGRATSGLMAAATNLIKQFLDSDVDIAALANRSLGTLPVASDLPAALAQTWRSLYLSLDFVPRTLLIVPSLDSERIRRHILCLCSQAAASCHPAALLVVAADESSGSIGVSLPSGATWRSLAEFRTDLDFQHKVAILVALIHSLGPQSVVVLDSPAGWEVFARHGRIMCQYARLFAALVSPAGDEMQTGHDHNSKLHHLWRCLTSLAGVYVDSREWLDEIRADNGLQPTLRQKFHLLSMDASDAEWTRGRTNESDFLSMKTSRRQRNVATTEITAVLNVHNEGFLALPSLQSMVLAKKNAAELGIKVELLIVADFPDTDTRRYLKVASEHGARIIELDVDDLGMARNAAVADGQGRFFAFLDGDDLWCRDWLTKAYCYAAAASEPAVWHPAANLYFGSGGEPFWMIHHDIDSGVADWVQLALRNHWTSLSFAPREVYDRVPYCRTNLECGFGYEDWHWNAETVAHGFPHRTVPHTCHLIRQKEKSLVKRMAARSALMTPSSLFRRKLGMQDKQRAEILPYVPTHTEFPVTIKR
jgi:hypothetical protein